MHLRRLMTHLVILSIAGIGLFVQNGAASASTCDDNTCSGSDGNTAVNFQNNSSPQLYIGEIGNYTHDFGHAANGWPMSGPCPNSPWNQMCFKPNTASSAIARANTGGKTGLGFAAYYLGAGINNSVYKKQYAIYWDPYCWGFEQGIQANYDLSTYFSNVNGYNLSGNYTPIIFFDVEQDGSFNGSTTGNRQVFNGFTDAVANRTSTDPDCAFAPGLLKRQYGLYSNYSLWTTAVGTGSNYAVPHTVIWTSEYCCRDSYPTSWSSAEWFGGSSYDWVWQFYGPNKDFDVAKEPITFPETGKKLGN